MKRDDLALRIANGCHHGRIRLVAFERTHRIDGPNRVVMREALCRKGDAASPPEIGEYSTGSLRILRQGRGFRPDIGNSLRLDLVGLGDSGLTRLALLRTFDPANRPDGGLVGTSILADSLSETDLDELHPLAGANLGKLNGAIKRMAPKNLGLVAVVEPSVKAHCMPLDELIRRLPEVNQLALHTALLFLGEQLHGTAFFLLEAEHVRHLLDRGWEIPIIEPLKGGEPVGARSASVADATARFEPIGVQTKAVRTTVLWTGDVMLPACAHRRLERRCQHAEYNIPTTSGSCFDLTGSERHNASLMKNRKNEKCSKRNRA